MAIPTLHHRTFVAEANSANGQVGDDTVFHYHEQDGVVWADYRGGAIRRGSILGTRRADGTLDLRYHHVDVNGVIRTGICHTVVETLPDGRLRLHETWQWTSGDASHGTSVLVEVAQNSR